MPQNTESTPDVPDEPRPATSTPLDDAAAPDLVEADVVEPVTAEPVLVEPVDEPVTVEPVLVEPVTVEPVTVEPVAAAPVAAAPLAPPPPAPTSASGHVAVQPTPPREVVYLQAPTPPAARHNRGFGVLISFIGSLVFALLYLGAGAIIISMTPGANLEPTFRAFTMSAAFWIPIAAYLVFSVLFALIADRAAWWAHVIGSLFVAALTYLASVGVLALMYNVVGMTAEEGVARIGEIATSPFLIAAAALARECALWFGLAIAARGRRVKERNAAERAKFDSEVAEQRAAYERARTA